jgi:hypothetical protein
MASGTGVYEVLLGRKQLKFGAEKIKNDWHEWHSIKTYVRLAMLIKSGVR